MEQNSESRVKMQEADALVQQVVALANPSRPENVQSTKAQQAQQLKLALANKNKAELERCINSMEATTANAQRRLEELEPKSIQLVGLVKFIKDALARESVGMINNIKQEEERLAQAQRELAKVAEEIAEEKREIQRSIDSAKYQVLQMQATNGTPESNTADDEATIAQEEKNLKVLEDKLARLLEISDQNNVEFNEKHTLLLSDIESMQLLLDEATTQNKGKQETLAHENQKSADLEVSLRELEKKLASLRE